MPPTNQASRAGGWSMEDRMRFGDRVTNKFASDDNPRKAGYFVRKIQRDGKLNPGPHVEVTDGDGEFWIAAAEAIEATHD